MATSSTMQTDQPAVEETPDTNPFLFVDRDYELNALQQTPHFFAPPPAGPLQLPSPPLDPFQLPSPPRNHFQLPQHPLGPIQPPPPPFGPLQRPPPPLGPLQPPPGPLQPPPPPPGIEVNLNYYQPLHLAAKEGDWETAKRFIDSDNSALTAVISIQGMTALHVAASSSQSEFVENLVELIPAEALDARDERGCNALHYVAIGEAVNAAKALVDKNPALPLSMESLGQTPLFFAAYWGTPSKSKEMLWYLSTVTTNDFPSYPFTGQWSNQLILGITAAGFNDVTLYLLRRYPHLTMARDNTNTTILHVISSHPHLFPSGTKFNCWERFIYSLVPVEFVHEHLTDDMAATAHGGATTYNAQGHTPAAPMHKVVDPFGSLFWKAIQLITPRVKHVYNRKLTHKYSFELIEFVCKQAQQLDNLQTLYFFMDCGVLHQATADGVIEIVEISLKYFPDLLWYIYNNRSILHYAIENRREKLFNLMIDLMAQNTFAASRLDEVMNNMLHLAAKLAPSPQLNAVSGSALQMQRELQWFKEVEKMVNTGFKLGRNELGRTPRELFTESHKDLLEKGEKWMKDTSNSCMVVSTLIATVVFAAAFSVPGGNINDKGIPIFLKSNSFMVFAISDALALFSSTASLLMFLSILTSRYAEEDFLVSLPRKLVLGLASLFVAIVTMMIAFGAAFSIVIGERYDWVYVPVIVLACIPVTLFAVLQLPLFWKIAKSTYGPGIFRQRRKVKHKSA
ncbi:Ankyrin repeat family protein [Abeliophyllum distichum]|uniref:Ankyrin repeat family protein n=1 Tax=Abeliophyllum distichum TaxID=126358 RepID=A0ABD1VCR9_9LAMI